MLISVSKLTGPALDWAVAEAEARSKLFYVFLGVRPYSTDWALSGPIIDRERIDVVSFGTATRYATHPLTHPMAKDGTTTLIAAMRCYVAAKLGDEVDIPEET